MTQISSIETPCTGFLPLGEHGEDANEELGYHSIVGRSWTEVLSRNCSHPTLDKGLILEPTNNDTFKTDVYVDAAFACGLGNSGGHESRFCEITNRLYHRNCQLSGLMGTEITTNNSH